MGLGTVARVSGWAAMSLVMITTGSSAAYPPQAAQQRDAAEQQPAPGAGQNHATDPQASANDVQQSDMVTKERSLKRMEQDFLLDQKRIWTSPARLRLSDTQWLVPISGFAAGLLVTDRDFSLHLSHDPKTISHYNTMSNAGIGALVGGAAGLWLMSYPSGNDHWRETGLLAGQAVLNSLVVVEAMKYSLGRERPLQGDGSGHLFQGGASFPSEHAAAAWAVAGVIGHEYPGTLPRLLAYGLASAVSYSRIRAEQHFPADVLVGGIMGSLMAQQVYSRHHDPGLGGDAWRSIGSVLRGDGQSSPQNQGSPYVPLDSWVYPALDRLAAHGLIDGGFAGMRPWTRRECARLLSEAEDRVTDAADENEVTLGLVAALEREFRSEDGGTEASDG